MRAVKVEYRVKPDFVDQNKANIRTVMDRLRNHPIEGMLYSSFIKDDGQTFVHLNMAKDEETMNKLNEVKEFNEFRKDLMESDPVSPPQSVNLNLVGAGFNI